MVKALLDRLSWLECPRWTTCLFFVCVFLSLSSPLLHACSALRESEGWAASDPEAPPHWSLIFHPDASNHTSWAEVFNDVIRRQSALNCCTKPGSTVSSVKVILCGLGSLLTCRVLLSFSRTLRMEWMVWSEEARSLDYHKWTESHYYWDSGEEYYLDFAPFFMLGTVNKTDYLQSSRAPSESSLPANRDIDRHTVENSVMNWPPQSPELILLKQFKFSWWRAEQKTASIQRRPLERPSRNYKNTCLRQFRLCRKIKVAMPITYSLWTMFLFSCCISMYLSKFQSLAAQICHFFSFTVIFMLLFNNTKPQK